MPFYFLPAIKENTNIPKPIGKGWQTYGSKLIDDLRRDLDLGGYKPVSFKVDSIPDAWARPILFEMALYDPDHILHEHVLGEWEGMLALLALREIRHIRQLSVKPVKISALDGDGTPGTMDFMEALGRMLPVKHLAQGTEWNSIHVILCNDNPIAITSPSTLVCTAIDYKIPDVRWFNGFNLTSPVSKLNAMERNALVFWLENLKSSLVNDRSMDRAMLNKLLDLMGDRDKGFIRKLNAGRDQTFHISSNTLGIREGIFRYLNLPVASDGHDGIETSNILLMPSPEKNPSKNLLIIEEDMWGMDWADIRVYGSVTMDMLPFGGTGKDRKIYGEQVLPPNTEWRIAEDFFTEKLFYMELEDVFPGGLRNSVRDLVYTKSEITVISPLNAELLEQFTPDDLNSRVSYEVEGEDITVRLELTVKGFDDGPRNLVLKKTYSNKNDEIKMLSINVPMVEVWPNFTIAGGDRSWQTYYTYYRRTGLNSFYCEPYPSGREAGERVTVKDNYGILKEVVRMTKPPEAMLCKAQLNSARTNSVQTLDAGLILLKQPEEIIPQGKVYNIGVDFGTTGTVVYTQADNSAPASLKLRSRLMHVTDSRTASEDLLYQEFMPYFVTSDNGKSTFLSIFHKFPGSGVYPSMLKPLMDGHIYFFDRYDRFNATSQGIETNLKWGDMQQRICAGAFMQQLCLQCAAEAVANGASFINWRFSFPTAFSKIETQSYERQWSQIAEETGLRCGLPQANREMGLLKMSESIASARYFLSVPGANASLTRGFVCIDIGGGTTDLSIWQGNNNFHLLQASLKFAGRDIFLELLRKKPGFLSHFGVGQVQLSKLEELKNEKWAFYAQAEALIAEKGGEMLETLPRANSLPDVEGFVNIIALAFAGIYYYIGQLLRYLVLNGKFTRRLPNIYIGGNGSSILHWLASGAYSKKSYINEIFKGVLTDAAGMDLKEDFEIYGSSAPKTEVACGLVCDAKHILQDSDFISNILIAGEDFTKGGVSEEEKRICSYLELIGTGDVKAGLETAPELGEVRRFIESYNRNAGSIGFRSISANEGFYTTIRDHLNNILLAEKGKKEEEMRVEPLFLTALKKIMELKTNEWSDM